MPYIKQPSFASAQKAMTQDLDRGLWQDKQNLWKYFAEDAIMHSAVIYLSMAMIR